MNGKLLASGIILSLIVAYFVIPPIYNQYQQEQFYNNLITTTAVNNADLARVLYYYKQLQDDINALNLRVTTNENDITQILIDIANLQSAINTLQLWQIQHPQISEYDYIVGKWDNGTYYALSGETGTIACSGDNASEVIQNCADILMNGGAIYIKTGLYEIDTKITLGSNILLCGSGSDTILKQADNSNLRDIIQVGSNTKISDIAFDGNKVNQASGNGRGVYAENSENVTIENCYFKNTKGISILFYQCFKCLADSNRIINSSEYGILVSRTNFSMITNNIVEQPDVFGSGHQAIVIANSTHSSITTNTVYNSSIQIQFSTYCKMADNTIINPGADTGIDHSKHCLVTGNIVINAEDNAFSCYYCSYCVIDGNIGNGSQHAGICIDHTNYTIVSDNSMGYAGQAGSGFRAGIEFYFSYNCTCMSNYCHNNLVGIRATQGDFNQIHYNDVRNGNTTPLECTETNTNHTNNFGAGD